jgi:hypothetical protein
VRDPDDIAPAFVKTVSECAEGLIAFTDSIIFGQHDKIVQPSPGHKPHSGFRGRRACPLWCQRVGRAGEPGRPRGTVALRRPTDGERKQGGRYLLIVVAGSC